MAPQSLDLEGDPLVKHEMDEETTEQKASHYEAERTLYDVAYWKRALRTGCMIMVILSCVSLIGSGRVCASYYHIRYIPSYLGNY